MALVTCGAAARSSRHLAARCAGAVLDPRRAADGRNARVLAEVGELLVEHGADGAWNDNNEFDYDVVSVPRNPGIKSGKWNQNDVEIVKTAQKDANEKASGTSSLLAPSNDLTLLGRSEEHTSELQSP